MTTLRRSKLEPSSLSQKNFGQLWNTWENQTCLAAKSNRTKKRPRSLNKQFYQIFNHSLPPLDPDSFKQPKRDLPENLRCTEDEVLSNLDTTKANGPDEISAKMLKATAETITCTPSITMLFNLSIKNCELPYDWKLAHVSPIPKSNDKSDPLNYRPISLLSILVKLLEKHMYSKILEHLSFLSNK